MRVTANFSGGRELDAALRELGEKAATKVGRTVMRKNTKELFEQVKAHAPRGRQPTRKSRRLKSGKQVFYDYGRLTDDKNLKFRKLRNAPGSSEIQYVITVGNAFWGRFYEFGTQNQPARPFMRPVWDQGSRPALENIKNDLWVGIAKEAKKQRRILPNGRNA